MFRKWTKNQGQTCDFRKSPQKCSKTEKSQKGVYLGREIFKGKKYWRGVPAAILGILWVGKKNCIYFFEIFLRIIFFWKKFFWKIFRGYQVLLSSAVMLLCWCRWWLLRVLSLWYFIEILILRLFLGDFRRGKRVLGRVTHFSLLSAKFKGFWGVIVF